MIGKCREIILSFFFRIGVTVFLRGVDVVVLTYCVLHIIIFLALKVRAVQYKYSFNA